MFIDRITDLPTARARPFGYCCPCCGRPHQTLLDLLWRSGPRPYPYCFADRRQPPPKPTTQTG